MDGGTKEKQRVGLVDGYALLLKALKILNRFGRTDYNLKEWFIK
jgi:hypothetical protein